MIHQMTILIKARKDLLWGRTGLAVPRLKVIQRKRDILSFQGPDEGPIGIRIVVLHYISVSGGDLNKLYRVGTKR